MKKILLESYFYVARIRGYWCTKNLADDGNQLAPRRNRCHLYGTFCLGLEALHKDGICSRAMSVQ